MINNKYDKGTFCLEFNNEEIMKYLVEPLNNVNGIKIVIKSPEDDILEFNTSEEIGTVVFDGEKEDVFISFNHCEVSIYFLGEEIMFIDESIKDNYTSSDTDYNIVFEGELRSMNHNEILTMFREIIKIVCTATDVVIKTTSLIGNQSYEKYDYEVDLVTENINKAITNFSNINFNEI